MKRRKEQVFPNGHLQLLRNRLLHVTEGGDEDWAVGGRPAIEIASIMLPDGQCEYWVWVWEGSAAHRALQRLRPEFGWTVRTRDGRQEQWVRPAPEERG